MTSEGPFQPKPFCDSMILRPWSDPTRTSTHEDLVVQVLWLNTNYSSVSGKQIKLALFIAFNSKAQLRGHVSSQPACNIDKLGSSQLPSHRNQTPSGTPQDTGDTGPGLADGQAPPRPVLYRSRSRRPSGLSSPWRQAPLPARGLHLTASS